MLFWFFFFVYTSPSFCLRIFWESESASHSVVSDSLRPHGLYSSWNSPHQKSGVGSLSLLQGIFPTRGWTQVSCIAGRFFFFFFNQLSHKGSPRILEWVAYPYSRGSSWTRNQTGVSCIVADSLPTELSGKLAVLIFVPPVFCDAF